MFLRHLVPWPSVDIHGKFYGERPKWTPPSGVGGIGVRKKWKVVLLRTCRALIAQAYNGDLWSGTTSGVQGHSPCWGVRKSPKGPKLKTVELADTQRRGKSAKFCIFWTQSSAQNKVDSQPTWCAYCSRCSMRRHDSSTTCDRTTTSPIRWRHYTGCASQNACSTRS